MRKGEGTGSYIFGFHEETPSERKLAAAMQKAGLGFEKEVSIKRFTVDFLIDEWLVVEVDGESHIPEARRAKDIKRQKAIEEAGFQVLRVRASELSRPEDVKRQVRRITQRVRAGRSLAHSSSHKFDSGHYRAQVEKARLALIEGRKEQQRRAALGRTEGGSCTGRQKDEETMEDYFSDRAEDFKQLLSQYEWGRKYSMNGESEVQRRKQKGRRRK